LMGSKGGGGLRVVTGDLKRGSDGGASLRLNCAVLMVGSEGPGR
jgi:hypothetical protein